jgi:hypothetical protein
VFTRDHIPAGAPLLAFLGPLISLEAALAKGPAEADAMQIGPTTYVDLEEPGRTANHSCQPNAGVSPDLVLFALRSIQPGEQLTYDYSTTMAENLWELDCACGRPNCRRRVRDFVTLPPPLQAWYLERNATTAHVRELALSLSRTRPYPKEESVR